MDFDLIALGQRIRHHRRAAGMTLQQLGTQIGSSASHLSLIETAQREAGIALLSKIAAALGVNLEAFTTSQRLDRRTELTIALERIQRSEAYKNLQLPKVRSGPTLPLEVLEAMVGLYEELVRRTTVAAATPEEARRANARLRYEMRERNNYYSEIEEQANNLLAAIDYSGGPLSEHLVDKLTRHLGFGLVRVPRLPHSTRSLTDLKNHRVYIPESGWGGHDPRTIVLQTLGHQVLSHKMPANFAQFLKQRVAVNYFAAALLAPEKYAVPLLLQAKQNRDISIEDLRDAFGISYETAAHRFTNLATKHLGILVDFVKAHDSGTIYKVYENDGYIFASDPIGCIEGQLACRRSGPRQVFQKTPPGVNYYQYTDNPNGTYWSVTQIEPTESRRFAVSVGARFDDAKWFRGRETTERLKSTCPDPSCCRDAPRALAEKWEGQAWPSARAHSHLLATLPPGVFPGVDSTAIFEFLEAMEKDSYKESN
jgi:predicted transcriptional regulator/DNA-binding XRE family transcriptional regulator